MIITRTPLRISLVGGGTDMASFYQEHPGAVVSFAISKYVYVSVNPKFDGNIRVSYSKTENVDDVSQIKHDLVRETLKENGIKKGLEIVSISDIPGGGTGLGSSSAFTVGLINALKNQTCSPQMLAENAYMIEYGKCRHPVGKQDQYACAQGDLNFFEFSKSGVVVHPHDANHDLWLHEFEKYGLLLWTGQIRDANTILKAQDSSFADGANVEAGKKLAFLAASFWQEMLAGCEMWVLGEIMDEGWKVKKSMVNTISNERIDKLYALACYSGAYGGKLLGAGGGGFLFFLADPADHERISAATGLQQVGYKIDTEGSKVIYHDG